MGDALLSGRSVAMPPGEILVARSYDRDALRRRLRDGEVQKLRRGAYLDEVGAVGRGERELARIAAVDRQIRKHVFALETALQLWGIRVWRRPAQVHVIQGYRPSAAAARDIARHSLPLPDDDITEVAGFRVTTVERTLVDVARLLHPLRALVAIDHALALGVDQDALVSRIAAMGSARGAARGGHVATLADSGAETPYETWLRYIALRAGLPRPRTQWPVQTRLGRFYADLGWPDHGVLAEFDGQIKYVDGALGDAHVGADELLREKRRTDAIHEATGIVAVRATAKDHPESVRRRLEAKFPRDLVQELRPDRLLPPVGTA